MELDLEKQQLKEVIRKKNDKRERKMIKLVLKNTWNSIITYKFNILIICLVTFLLSFTNRDDGTYNKSLNDLTIDLNKIDTNYLQNLLHKKTHKKFSQINKNDTLYKLIKKTWFKKASINNTYFYDSILIYKNFYLVIYYEIAEEYSASFGTETRYIDLYGDIFDNNSNAIFTNFSLGTFSDYLGLEHMKYIYTNTKYDYDKISKEIVVVQEWFFNHYNNYFDENKNFKTKLRIDTLNSKFKIICKGKKWIKIEKW